MQKKVSKVIIALLILNIGVCYAKESNNTIAVSTMGKSIENDNYYRLEKTLLDEEGKSVNQDVVAQPDSPNITNLPVGKLDTVYIARVVTGLSEILSLREINELVAKYEGREVSIKELNQLINEFNGLYRAKNYLTAVAILPPQELEDGIVKINLVEGKVGSIIVTGNKHTNNSYFTSRMSLQKGNLFSMNSLKKDLMQFNLLNDTRITAELSPGKNFGTTDYILKVQEPDKYQTTVFVDNAGSEETGIYRSGISWSDNSLTKNRDALSLMAMKTNGVISWSGSYNTPINDQGTKIGFTYDENQSTIVAGPFTSLNIDSSSSSWGMSLNHPFHTTNDYKLNGFIEAYKKKNGSTMSQHTIGDTDISTSVMGYSVQKQWNNGFLYIRNDLTVGKARYKVANSEQNFKKYTLSLVNQVRLNSQSILTFKVVGQRSSDRMLPSTEKFTIGGMNTVRGYKEGFLNGDEGFFSSIEISFPLANQPQIRGSFFVDYGKVFSSDVDNAVLTSVGLSTVVTLSPSTSLKVVLGIPLNKNVIYNQHEKPRVHLFYQSQI